MITFPGDALDTVADLEEWTKGDLRSVHPLIRWYAATEDPRPWTLSRVPTALVPKRERMPLVLSLRENQLDQQLSINCRLRGRAHRTYLLGRASSDFTDEDLIVARCVQRSLMALDRQIAVIQQFRQLQSTAFDVGLTGREISVLDLIAAGHTTREVSRRLGYAPRTVDKHLERIYRKLGVRDKLNAVRVDRSWSLIPH